MAAVPLFLLTTLLPLLVLTAQQDSSIVNGREAKPHSRPYMVSVQQNKRHKCGGFLVSDSFVMTAAHCLTWRQNLTVLLGAHDISENQKSNRAEVKFYHIHPGFEADTLKNDIMLLQGDSGGPLVCKGTAVGIVSFNDYGNCNKPEKPNVYTRISKYLSWVKCIISSVN
ncbi:tryptase-2-like [Conger conger]|uniref:tryptase-2-like n=1 Tax=Conger conger TaxID=82655 RepID=UPI002A5AD568|nr:tryptase-2-like [Conger conger]